MEHRNISTADAAKLMGIGVHAVRRLYQRGKLNGERVEGSIVLFHDEVMDRQIQKRARVREKLGGPIVSADGDRVVPLLETIVEQNQRIIALLTKGER